MSSNAAIDDMIIGEHATIREVMSAINCSGLEVALRCDSRRRLIAVVTDGDIRRALLAGVGLDESAREVGSQKFYSVGLTATRADIIRLMVEKSINCVPVLDDAGRLCDLHSLRAALRSGRCDSSAVIMAGGLGTRLGELTDSLPKPMLPIGDRPILQHLVEHCVAHGVEKIYLSINYLGSMIEDFFEDGSRFMCKIEYLRENQPLGTGGALSLISDKLTAPLLIMNGDLLTRINITRLLKFHRAGGFPITMALRTHKVQVPFGVAEVDGARVSRLEEKPELTYQINAGIYVVEPSEVVRIPKNEFYPITRLLDSVLSGDGSVGAYHMQEPWVDIGNPDDFRSVHGGDLV